MAACFVGIRMLITQKLSIELVAAVGLEPTTYGL